MSPLRIKGFHVLGFRLAFFQLRVHLGLSCFELSLGLNAHHIGFLVRVLVVRLSFSSRLVNLLDHSGLNLTFDNVLFSGDLSNEDIADLVCLYNGYFQLSGGFDFHLLLLHLGSGDLSFQLRQPLVVLPVHVGQYLVLLVLDCQLLVFVVLYVVGQRILYLCSFLQSLRQLCRYMYFGDVASFEEDPEDCELLVEFSQHFLGHFSL